MKWLRDLSIIASVVCVLLATLELVLRFLLPFPLSTTATYAVDEDTIYFHKGRSLGHEVSPVGEFPITQVRYNSLGFRGSWETLPSDRTSTALLGDSFVEGRQVSEPETISELLNDRFRDKFFINAGCSAYTSTTEYLLFKAKLLPLGVREVFLFFTFNDYRDNKVYDGGYLNHPELLVSGPSPELIKRRLGEQEASRAAPRRFRDWLATGAYLSLLGQRLRPAPLPTSNAVDRNNFAESFLAINKATQDMTTEEVAVLEFTHRGLAEISRLANQHSVKLTILLIPLPTQVGAGEWRTGKTVYEGLPEDYVETLSLYQSRLLDFCTAQGIRCVDLLPSFRQAATQGELFFPYDGHWTPFGQRVVADVVSRLIGDTM